MNKPLRRDKQVVLRPRAGVISARALPPLVAAPSLFLACRQPRVTAVPAAAPDVGPATATATVSCWGQGPGACWEENEWREPCGPHLPTHLPLRKLLSLSSG